MDRLIFIVCLIALFTNSLVGQQNQSEADETPLEEQSLQEVVVTAFNVSRRLLDTPGSITMIGPQQIEKEQAATIIPVLNQASGVFAHSGSLTTSRITIRGIGARIPYGTGKIRAYFNNIPLTNGSGITIVDQIDPSVIERIELIKGPATSAYGAGLGGTINITARQPSLKPPGVSNNIQAGSFGLLNNTISLDAAGNNIATSLVYNRTQREGFRQNDNYRRDALTSVSQLKLGERSQATFLLYLADMRGHIASSIDSLTFITDPGAAAQNWLRTRGYNDTRVLLAGISGTHRLSEELAFDLGLFTTIHNEKENRPFDFLYEDRNSAGIRIKGSWRRISGMTQIQIITGGELFLENFRYSTFQNIDGIGQQGSIISRNREIIVYNNIFIQADLDLGNINFSSGINANTNKIDYRDLMHIGGTDRSDIYDYGLILSPRISVNYRFLERHAVFATISHGFSPPSLSETLTPEGYINPAILPEKSWNYEAGLRGSIAANNIFYDLSAYHMRVRDLLVAHRVGEDAWVGRNAGRSLHRGLEIELQGYLYRAESTDNIFWQVTDLSLRAALSLNHFRFTEFVDNQTDYSGKRIPGVPSVYLNADLFMNLAGGMYIGFHLKYSGRMPMNDSNTKFSEPFTIPGVTAGYQNQVRRWNYNIYARVDNIFNKHYASMILVNAPSFGNSSPRYYYPGMPVHFSFGLRLGHQWI